MKKLLLLALLFTGIVNAQIVTIPDPNLKAALINPIYVESVSGIPIFSVDTNANGQIELSEALDIRQIVLDNSSISDMTGIEAFVNMIGLSCSGNQFATLTLTSLTQLQSLSCRDNAQLTFLNVSGLSQLTTPDITNCTALQHLDVSGCSLVTSVNITDDSLQYLNASNCAGLFSINVVSAGLNFINFNGCTGLNNLSVWNSQLVSLDILNLPSLNWINIYQNAQLSSLTFLNCPSLATLNCTANNLSSLDVSGLPSITALTCANNLLTTLDVSNLTQLTNLVCFNNQLQTLFAKNGQNEVQFGFDGNPTLQFICVDDSQVASVQASLNSLGYTNTVCNSYCSFTPGGNYNTITGINHFDANNNGCDNGDIVPNNVRINITDGTNTGASFSNNLGNYFFYTQAGSFTIMPSLENPAYFNFSPSTATIPFANNNNNTATQNFCITANGTHHDVEMVISPFTPARPGFDAVYKLIYKNKGNQTESVSLNFNYDESRLDFVTASATPTGASGSGSLQFSILNVRPFENGSVLVTLHVNAPTDSPAVNVGDVLNFTSFIDVTTDENWTDNAFTYNQTVVGSFDPNDITCLEGNVVAASEIGNYLHYAINFENTGTDTAENIVVKMQVDPAQFNLNSLQLMNASHPVAAKITGNIVEFVFENINLNIGGHGHILLKLKSNSALSVGSMVSRRADIFFDYNLPVDTGSANTTYQVLRAQDFQTDPTVTLYPNPTSGLLSIKSQHTVQSVAIYDVQGRILVTHTSVDSESKVDLSHYPKGIYFVKVATEAGNKTEKIIRE